MQEPLDREPDSSSRSIRRARRAPAIAPCVALLGFLAAAAAFPSPDPPDEIVVLEEHLGTGEQCLVCRKAMHDKPVVVVRYRGRTFHVGAGMLDEFRRDPDRYFRALEAHSGLFDEASVTRAKASPGYGWFGFGTYVLVGLIFAAACGALAVARSRPPWPWFFGGLVFNVFALLVLLTRPRGDASGFPAGVPRGLRKVPTTRAPVACSACGSQVHPAARRCSRCSAALSPAIPAESLQI